eukprot:m.12581 g.12581  ORF g.12581 m.12581 type:complete len:113 (+) comp5836_c0_seq1:3076-3414(+)
MSRNAQRIADTTNEIAGGGRARINALVCDVQTHWNGVRCPVSRQQVMCFVIECISRGSSQVQRLSVAECVCMMYLHFTFLDSNELITCGECSSICSHDLVQVIESYAVPKYM